MQTPVLTASFGDDLSHAQIARLARAPGATVVAVAIETGDGPPGGEIRAGALAAGATRCHVLDVRDEFVRAVVLPSARCEGTQRASTYTTEVAAFIASVVRTVADIEQGVAVDFEGDGPRMRAARRPAAAGPATLALRLANGEPVALNDIPMTLAELVESIETIAGTSAVDVLGVAYMELGGRGDGQVVLCVEHGACTVAPAAAAHA